MISFSNVTIGEIGKVVTGKTPKTDIPEYYGDDFMFIGPTDLHNHFVVEESQKMISERGLLSIKGSRIKGTSILVGCIGWDMGNVAITESECATNQQINSITNIDKKYNPFYIYYWLKGKKEFLYKQASVTRTPILNKSAFSAINIPVPSKDVQDSVASILQRVDEKIKINNKINAALEAMAKLIYDYWFVQFDFPDDEGRPYKSSGGKMVYNEELKREIPEGWMLKAITEEMDVQYGYPFSTKLFNEHGEGSAVVRIRNILDNSISIFSTENVDDKYLLNKGDLLVGMDGNFHLNFWDKEGCYLNQRCVRIRSVDNSCVSQLQALFQIEPYIKAREKNVSRTTVGHLSAKDINSLKVLIPSSEQMKNRRVFFDSILSKIVVNREKNNELTKLRNWLLPMLMNGQVTISTG